MADNPVTWGDLIKTVLFLLGAGVLFYLILAAANLVGILKNINQMLTKNRAHIDESLKHLPAITENVTKVTDIVKDEMESIQKVMGNIGKISDSARDAVDLVKKDILVKAKNLLDVFDWIRNIFQDKNKRKKEIIYKYKYKPAAETVEEEVSGDWNRSGEGRGEQSPDSQPEESRDAQDGEANE